MNKPDLKNNHNIQQLLTQLKVVQIQAENLSHTPDFPFEYTKFFNLIAKEGQQQILAIHVVRDDEKFESRGGVELKMHSTSWAKRNITGEEKGG